MAQNIKIVSLNYKGTTAPTNVLFGDSITIKQDSTLALTSFAAQFDWRQSAVELKNQTIVVNYQQVDQTKGTFNIVLPTKEYYSYNTLLDDLVKAISINFSPMIYLTGANFLDYNMFQGLNMSYQSLPPVTGAIEGTAAILEIKKQALSPFNFHHHSGDDNIFQTTIDSQLTPFYNSAVFIAYKGTGKRTMSKLKGVNALEFTGSQSGASISNIGGMFLSFQGLQFIQDELTIGESSLKISKKKTEGITDKTIAFVYELTEGAEEGDLPEPNFSIQIFNELNQLVKTIPIGDEFYNYKTEYQTDPTQALTSLPFQDFNEENANRTLFFTQKNGYIVIGYYDPVTDTIIDFTQNQTEFEWDLNETYDFEYAHDVVSGPVDDGYNILFQVNGNKGTIKSVGQGGASIENFNKEYTIDVDLTNAEVVMKTLGFEKTFDFKSIEGNILTYIPPFPIELFQTKQREIALEIDTIKVKNFVGITNDSLNKTQGRRNVIAYFTPIITKSQHLYNLDFTPNEPIYLKVDSKQDIDLTSLNFRLYYTLDNKPVQSDASVSFVLTNK